MSRKRRRIRLSPLTTWTLGLVAQALLLAAVLIGLVYLIAALSGCASGPAPAYDPVPIEKPEPFFILPDPPPVKLLNNRAELAPTNQPPPLVFGK